MPDATSHRAAKFIRSDHPNQFRSGQWARILTIAPSQERDCYVVQFPDGATDFWVVSDVDAGYQFADEDPDA